MDCRSQVTIWTGQMLHVVNHKENVVYTLFLAQRKPLKNRREKLVLALNVTLLVLNL